MKKNFTKSFLQILLKASFGMCALASISVNTLQAQGIVYKPHERETQPPAAHKFQSPPQVVIQNPKDELDLQLKEASALFQRQLDFIESKSTKKALQALSKVIQEMRTAKKRNSLTLEHIEKGLQLTKSIHVKVHSKSCSGCHSLEKALHKLLKTLVAIRDELLEEVEELSEHLECLQRIVIDQLPITITESGSYCVKESLTYEAVTSTVVPGAITITADNVDIDLGNNTITVDPTTTAIFAQNILNLCIHNGTIESSSPSTDPNSIGISLMNVTHGAFSDIIFSNTLIGYAGSSCSDQTFMNCSFNHPGQSNAARGIELFGGEGYTIESCFFDTIGPTTPMTVAARAIDVNVSSDSVCSEVSINQCQFINTNSSASSIFLIGSSNVTITNCDIQNSNTGPTDFSSAITLAYITLESSEVVICQNISIQNCTVLQSHLIGIAAFSYDNLLIENCKVVAASDSTANSLQLGFTPAILPKTNAILRNCSFSNPNATNGFDNVAVGGAEGLLIENCTFDAMIPVNNSYNSSNLHIYQSTVTQTSNTVKVLNSTFSNQCNNHITVEGSSQAVTIDSCVINNALSSGINFISTYESTIKNCEISNSGGSGIVLDSSQYNQIIGNTVTQCDSSNGAIYLLSTAQNNTIKDNTVSNNQLGIHSSSGSTNEFYNNTACNNTTSMGDCVGLSPSPTQMPGVGTAVAGTNVCCTSS